MKSTILWLGQNKIMVGLELPPVSLKKPTPPPPTTNILLAKNEDIFLHGTFYFLPVFNMLNFKFEKKNPLPPSESRNLQATIPITHFFKDGPIRHF